MQISVAMATWQGARFLPAQLATIAGQLRLPDELVVVDDASDDETIEVVEAFAEKAPFKVLRHRLEHRHGSTRAFERAIEESSGDVIVLADQDDLWLPQKLSRLETIFRERPDTAFAFTDALVIDDANVVQPETLWEVRKFGPALQERVRQHPFAVLAHRWLVTGCTIAFRADLRSVLLPFPTDVSDLFPPMIHDRWLSLVLSGVGPVAVVDEPLMAYRIHPAQQIGLASVTSLPPVARQLRKVVADRPEAQALREYQIAHLREVHRRLVDSDVAGAARLSEVEGSIAHLETRIRLPHQRTARYTPILRELAMGRYHRYSRGWRSALADLLKP